MFFITGDTHGDFSRIISFCERFKEKLDLSQNKDTMIVLGDAGINYWGPNDWRDKKLKKKLAKLPITIFSIHGNHERRPETIPSYVTKIWNEGAVYYEKAYPNILFAKDGEVFNFDGKSVLVAGGAYSVDKYYRLMKGIYWFEDEQPSDEIKARVEASIAAHNGKFDVVLTHTAPLRYEPIEWFLTGLDQSKVDKSTEEWLDKLYDKINCKKWYAGHYHGEKKIDNLIFMFESIAEF